MKIYEKFGKVFIIQKLEELGIGNLYMVRKLSLSAFIIENNIHGVLFKKNKF